MVENEKVHSCGLTSEQMLKLWELHTKYEFEDRSVEKTMTTMTEHPALRNVPTKSIANGIAGVKNFYQNSFVHQNPPDISVEVVSRTIGDVQIVEELVLSFTHTQVMDWILPGIPPTSKKVRVPFVVIVGFENGKIGWEHIYWDQATVLHQIGLLQKTEQTKNCFYGAEVADGLVPQK